MVPQIASGAPSQQFAFMWQCGHSHRVAIGSNSTPQKSQGTVRTVRRVVASLVAGTPGGGESVEVADQDGLGLVHR